MPMPAPPALPSAPRRRSLLVTLLALLMMLTGALGLPISAITALMLIAGSYGTANAGFLDSCGVVLGPLVLVGTGLGLLKRWTWALYTTMLMLAVVAVHHGWKIAHGPSETKTHTTETGVRVTVTTSGPHAYALPILAVCLALEVGLGSARVRSEFRAGPPIVAKRECNLHKIQPR